MLSNDDASDMIYIIQTPLTVHIESLPAHAQLAPDSYRVIQVGKGSGGRAGLTNRMYDHYLSWTYATGIMGDYYKPPKSPPSYALDRASQYSDLLGVIVRQPHRERIEETETYVREHIGIKLRTDMVKQLLQRPYEGFAGDTVLRKGGDFSETELRLVHVDEVNLIRDWFRTQWAAGYAVRLSSFSRFTADYARRSIPGVRVTLLCTYSSTPPSKGADRGVRLAVYASDTCSISVLSHIPNVDRITRGIQSLNIAAEAAAPVPASAGVDDDDVSCWSCFRAPRRQ